MSISLELTLVNDEGEDESLTGLISQVVNSMLRATGRGAAAVEGPHPSGTDTGEYVVRVVNYREVVDLATRRYRIQERIRSLQQQLELTV